MKYTLVLFHGVFALLASCSTVKVRDQIEAREALERICRIGSTLNEVKGNAYLKIDAPVGKGTLLASVRVTSVPTLDMQVSNPFGGLEAEVRVRGKTYSVEYADPRYKRNQGNDFWNSIPLEWISTLFLGRIPCPPQSSREPARIEWNNENELLVEVLLAGGRSRERYVYRIDSRTFGFFAPHLTWETLGPLGNRVEFAFSDPDLSTGQPLKWEVRSKDGLVKLRWQDREVK